MGRMTSHFYYGKIIQPCSSHHQPVIYYGHTLKRSQTRRRGLEICELAMELFHYESRPLPCLIALGCVQGGAPKIAKLVYNSNNYGL